MRLRGEEGNIILHFTILYKLFIGLVFTLLFFKIGFTQILDSGYDDEADIIYIALNKLDADLNTLVKNGTLG